MKKINLIMSLVLIFSVQLAAQAEDQLKISDFANESLEGWEEKEFNGLTIYRFVKDGNTTVLEAQSKDSASGLFKTQEINIKEYPYLNWRWKTTSNLNTTDERSKEGDDYSARIYIIKEGTFFWNTKALNYVWSNKEAKGNAWPSAYAPDNSMMISVRSAEDDLNTWVSEKRHIANDFLASFNEEIDTIDGIAVMTDTDDSDGEAKAFFGEIYFSKN